MGKDGTLMSTPNRIRVLHLIASNFAGGPEKQILRHAAEDHTPQMEIWVGSFRDTPKKTEILCLAEALRIPSLEFVSGRFVPRAVLELLEALDRYEIAILCTHGYKANVIGYLASKFTDRPHIAFVRGWTGENFRVRIYDALEKFVLRRASRVVCVSRLQAGQIGQGRASRIPPLVIANAVEVPTSGSACDRAALRARLGLPLDAYLVGAAGRLSPEKGHSFLLDAASFLLPRITNLKVVVLGEGAERTNLEQRRLGLGLQHCVLLPGFQKDARQWLQACDLVVNPSLTEGMPNVVLEAMALGLPVVATAVGAVPDMIIDGESGLLVPAGDATAIEKAIWQLFRGCAEAQTMGQRGQDRVRQFSPQCQRNRLSELYADVLGLPPGRLKQETSAGTQDCRCPFISVVLPVRNEAACIGSVLDGLLAQDYPEKRFELLVVDGFSSDGTGEIVLRCAQGSPVSIQLLQNPKRWSSAGRNIGITASRGEFVAFVDGHCEIVSRNLLRDIASLFSETGADCLCRPQPLAALGGKTAEIIAAARASFFGHAADSTIFDTYSERFLNPTSSGAIYRRRVFEQVGHFDESFDACEDLEFNYRVNRAGLVAYSSPRLMVAYQARTTYSSLWKQMTRYGRGRFRFMCKHPDAITSTQLALPGFTVVLAVCLAAGLRFPVCLYSAAALAGTYVAVSLAVSARMALQQRSLRLLAAPMAFAAIHFGLANGFLQEAVASLWKFRGNFPVNSGVRTSQSHSGPQASTIGALGKSRSDSIDDYGRS
jgi:glycosyltransferase involved in cell wall biosynthesis/GT2 family glycosyltransferase